MLGKVSADTLFSFAMTQYLNVTTLSLRALPTPFGSASRFLVALAWPASASVAPFAPKTGMHPPAPSNG